MLKIAVTLLAAIAVVPSLASMDLLLGVAVKMLLLHAGGGGEAHFALI